MRLFFLFLDGIGLGDENPESNPFARAKMPYLRSLMEGQPLTRRVPHLDNDQLTLRAIDANLGVEGTPQSATGQAVLLTGLNIPALIGYHYGPKPNPQVAHYLKTGTLFSRMVKAGKRSALLNAYPPRYFEGIDSGRRLYSAIPLALTNAGLSLFNQMDYYQGHALSADFTGRGWHSFLSLTDAPLYEPHAAGLKLGQLAGEYDFSLFEYWASDYAGHKQDMDWAVDQLGILDEVLRGLFSTWRSEEGLILITSDHGNMEDLSIRRHTDAMVPLILYGPPELRRDFHQGITDLTGIAPAILKFMGLSAA